MMTMGGPAGRTGRARVVGGAGAGGDDADGGMIGRRAAVLVVVAAGVGAVVTFLPSCRLRIHPRGKLAYPTVGIVPRQFPPGSVRVPYRLRASPGPNPPYPTLRVGGIGLMKGTPGIVTLVFSEVVLRLVSFILVPPSSFTPSSLHDAMVVAVVDVPIVQGLTHGVTTTKVGGKGRQERELRGPGVRHRRQAPGRTSSGVEAGNVVKVVVVAVKSMVMSSTAMSGLVGVVMPSVGSRGRHIPS